MTVKFTSTHPAIIFENFHLLLELDPVRAEQLRGAYPQLTDALDRYPKGLKSIEEEAERAKMPPRDPSTRRFIIGGGKGNIEYAQALIESADSKDFDRPLGFAFAKYQEDINPENPNGAPKAFWPSSAMYENIFHRMGKAPDATAERKLEGVPDRELRLFAQIEFAAGLCGLPELPSMRQRVPSRRATGQTF